MKKFSGEAMYWIVKAAEWGAEDMLRSVNVGPVTSSSSDAYCRKLVKKHERDGNDLQRLLMGRDILAALKQYDGVERKWP